MELVLPDIDEDLRIGLQRRAERHGRSLEAEARNILRAAVHGEDQPGLGTRIAARFAGWGLEEGELPERPFAPVKPMSFDQ